MIPAHVDHVSIIEDLNRWGIVDYKIELICGLSRGYVSQLKKDSAIQMSYLLAARLYNFWHDEHALHEPRSESGHGQTLALTT